MVYFHTKVSKQIPKHLLYFLEFSFVFSIGKYRKVVFSKTAQNLLRLWLSIALDHSTPNSVYQLNLYFGFYCWAKNSPISMVSLKSKRFRHILAFTQRRQDFSIMFNSSFEMGLKQAKASNRLISTALCVCDSTIIKMRLPKWQIILCTPQKIKLT